MDLKPFEEELGATPISQLMSNPPPPPPQEAPPQPPMGGDPRGPPPPMPQMDQLAMGHQEAPPHQLSHEQMEHLQQLPPHQASGMPSGQYNHYDQAPKVDEIPRPHYPEPPPTKKKGGFLGGMFSKMGISTDSNCKNNKVGEFILVVCIFILLNSKFVYRELSKLPGMGNIDPSLLALIVNSILAGIVFIIVKSFLL